MKIILHMGQSKTGTTSLQASLHAATTELSARKVLYPRFGSGFSTHHLLVALCGDPTRLPQWDLDRVGGPENAAQAAQDAWNQTCEEINSTRPEVLVLSSEYLLHYLDGAGKARLATLLAELSSDITPVIYVRHPVDHYRASLQQWIKLRDLPFPPVDTELREAILDTAAAFGRQPDLVAFDRQTLHGGDIVCDFASRFLAPWVKTSDLQGRTANVGLSAEALVLLVRLRAEAGGTYEVARRLARLVPRLQALDESDPPAQSLTLLPEVAEATLRSATGHRWLAETGLLQIPGLDVDRIDGAPVPDWMNTAPPESLFLHDPERLARLQASIVQRRPKAAQVKRQAQPSAKPIPRIRDLLLRFVLRKLASLEDRKTGAVPILDTAVRHSSQGDHDEDHSPSGNLDTGASDRA